MINQTGDYFAKHGYTVISVKQKSDSLHFLAKCSKTGKNETFILTKHEFIKIVHTGNKRTPWMHQTIYLG